MTLDLKKLKNIFFKTFKNTGRVFMKKKKLLSVQYPDLILVPLCGNVILQS
jgi:hypothetical protein